MPAGPDTPAPGEASDVRLERRAAERVARLVHHGPYEDETPSLSALRAFVADSGLVIAGAHSETYLNDPPG